MRGGRAVRSAAAIGALLLVLALPGTVRAQEAGDPGPWGAALRSLVFPGWGQRVQGRTTLGRTLLGVEAGLWGGFAGWKGYADWRAEDSRRWAALHAGADLDGKDALFFRRLAAYPDYVTYQAAAAASGSESIYPDEPDWRWRWDGERNWQRYRELRRLSRRSDALATLAIGGVVAVRLTGAALALIHGRMDTEVPEGEGAAVPPITGDGRIPGGGINAQPVWSFDVRTGTFSVRLVVHWN